MNHAFRVSRCFLATAIVTAILLVAGLIASATPSAYGSVQSKGASVLNEGGARVWITCFTGTRTHTEYQYPSKTFTSAHFCARGTRRFQGRYDTRCVEIFYHQRVWKRRIHANRWYRTVANVDYQYIVLAVHQLPGCSTARWL